MSPQKTPDLRTERLRLRLPTPADVDGYLAFYERNREHLSPWDPVRPEAFYTQEYWSRTLAEAREQYEAGLSLRLGVFLPSEEEGGEQLIGVANFSNFVHGAFQACHLGYSIDAHHEGQGLMREALEAALDFVFTQLGLHRVMANYQPTNTRSAGLLRRLGFETEGFAREYLYLAGAWRDHVLTAKIRPSR